METTQNHGHQSDEQLIRSHHDQGDQHAARTLFERYDADLQKKARVSASTHSGIDYQTFYDYFVDCFLNALRTFQPDRGVPFRKYVAVKLYRSDVRLIRDSLYTRTTNGDLRKKSTQTVISFDAIPHDRDGSDEDSERRLSLFAAKTDDYPYEIDEVTAICNEEERLAIKAAMAGASLADVARAVGRKGTQDALTKYGQRLMNRIRDKVREFYASIGTPLTV